MEIVVECKRCLYNTSHPLGLVLDDEGICSGCRVHEEKDSLDWRQRFLELQRLVKPYRSKLSFYDCIVPVSGGRDSHFILDIVIHKLKLKPLVVSYNKCFNTKTGIANLTNLRIKFNVDFQLKNVDPRIIKKITKTSLYQYGNPYWHCLAGQTVFPVQTATMMKIPLIIWGAHQGLEQVGMYSHTDNVEMTRRYRKDHDLFGVEGMDLLKTYNDITEEDIINFAYPSFSDIEDIGIRGIYLGNYIRWDQWKQHKQMVKKFNYRGRELNRTFDPYDHADCFLYTDIHDLLKLYKHGYSKVTDQVCREIRFGRISKQKGKDLVNYYENKPLIYRKQFADWLGIREENIEFILNSSRNKALWKEVSPMKWKKRNKIKAGPVPSLPREYKVKNVDMPDRYDDYITIGEGIY